MKKLFFLTAVFLLALCVAAGTVTVDFKINNAKPFYNVGDKIEDTSFSGGLTRSFERILQYTVTDPDGNKSQEFLSPEELGPEAARQYYALQEEIK